MSAPIGSSPSQSRGGRGTGWLLLRVLGLPGLLIAVAVGVVILVVAGSVSSSQAAVSPGSPGAGCSVKVGGNTPGRAKGAGGVSLSAQQMNNARAIVGVVRSRKLPQRAAEIALMTVMQESTMTVLNRGDLAGPDSRGLFQQRGSWGPLSVRMNPAGSTGLFLDRLVKIDGWATMDPVSAAHKVQGNARAEDYRKWQSFGVALAAALWTDSGTTVSCSGGSAPVAGVSGKLQTVLTAVHNELGLPYCWNAGTAKGPSYGDGGNGGRCPAGHPGFDCSGLVLFAYAQIGITLAHYAADQYTDKHGHQVPLADVQPGDLVFLSNSGRTTAGIHHVAMIFSVTGGHAKIIEAADYGIPVRIRDWRGAAEDDVMPYATRFVG